MRYATLPFSDKRISRIVLGTRPLVDSDAGHAAAMLDRFVAAGGTAVDTSWIYNRGGSQRALGRWLSGGSGRREKLFIIDKVCHSLAGDPETIGDQTVEGLRRMGIAQTDLLLLHHDNPRVPVSTFVSHFAEQVAAGRARAWGASNVSMERFEAMAADASRRGLPGPAALSNQFSLARWARPSSPESIACDSPAFRRWLAASRVPLFAWGSQAGGWFAHPDGPTDSDRYIHTMHDAMDTDANRERLRRAAELAGRLGRSPIQVALAWVWHQPFEAFGIVGCRTLDELNDSLGAADVTLTAEQAAWLNLED
ncbi:MAG: aldo/keto reductase [Planctomycetes bacterium]|nr:aldo/keto reductase [Planctomycetota bacterium]